ncbi:hypothetical protein D9615_004899 [Tricholomella constricta]|uniref:RRM domain-containing protein n=1 Tax=Tricholomella constricta TaxID=117010 RepID=A0A8H5HH90_9AGAR|nr:hypothetical protein D9615_004899 [Tricholomella constricta]
MHIYKADDCDSGSALGSFLPPSSRSPSPAILLSLLLIFAIESAIDPYTYLYAIPQHASPTLHCKLYRPSIGIMSASPPLPPLPDSPLSDPSAASSPAQQHSPSVSLSLSMSVSPLSSSNNSYSHYQSTLASPACSQDSSAGSAAIRLDTTTDEEEDESSSDVEIYLSSLGLNDSAASMSLSLAQSQSRAYSHQSQLPADDDSPVLPSHFPAQKPTQAQAHAQTQAQIQTEATSPQLPPAPAHSTIPLPPLSSSNPNSNSSSRPKFTFTPSSTSVSTVQGPSATEDSPTDQHAHAPDQTGKTPNVYINGLPPHFPEDQLFALAAPFGAVRSVRTFTRHVRDSESGYGFVLFETVEAAEKCILSLRRYRNLHPTFSKQAHKIPGTGSHSASVHAQAPLTLPLNIHLDTHASEEWGSEDGGGSASFKAKMESLHDRNSTNLYMEGLPLSIDEPVNTRGARVTAPYQQLALLPDAP